MLVLHFQLQTHFRTHFANNFKLKNIWRQDVAVSTQKSVVGRLLQMDEVLHFQLGTHIWIHFANNFKLKNIWRQDVDPPTQKSVTVLFVHMHVGASFSASDPF